MKEVGAAASTQDGPGTVVPSSAATAAREHSWVTESQNHRVVWDGRGLKDHMVPTQGNTDTA